MTDTATGWLEPGQTYRLLDASAQAEVDYFKAMHRHFVAYLAGRYRSGEAQIIAGLCDETLDRSGRLLGEVRDAARETA